MSSKEYSTPGSAEFTVGVDSPSSITSVQLEVVQSGAGAGPNIPGAGGDGWIDSNGVPRGRGGNGSTDGTITPGDEAHAIIDGVDYDPGTYGLDPSVSDRDYELYAAGGDGDIGGGGSGAMSIGTIPGNAIGPSGANLRLGGGEGTLISDVDSETEINVQNGGSSDGVSEGIAGIVDVNDTGWPLTATPGNIGGLGIDNRSTTGSGGGGYAKKNTYPVVNGQVFVLENYAGGQVEGRGIAPSVYDTLNDLFISSVDDSDSAMPGDDGGTGGSFTDATISWDVKTLGGSGSSLAGGSSAGTSANGNNASGATPGAAPIGGSAGGASGVNGSSPGGGAGRLAIGGNSLVRFSWASVGGGRASAILSGILTCTDAQTNKLL